MRVYLFGSRHIRLHTPLFLAALAFICVVFPAAAQDDGPTRNAASGYGAFITGPASNPVSFVNGLAYRTFGSQAPYLLPDFRPASQLNKELPRWIFFGVEERFRSEGFHNNAFKLHSDDSYFLNRFRLRM